MIRVRKKKKKVIHRGQRGISVVKLVCQKCKKEFEVNTTNIDAYTEDVRRKWVCLFCRGRKGGRR